MSESSRLDVREEYLQLARALEAMIVAELDVERDGGVVIGIAGESGSGKSVTATCLARVLSDGGNSTAVIHQDDYFHRPPRTNHEYRCHHLDSVGPQEVNLALLETHIAAFRERRDGISAPLVDYPANRFVTQRYDFGALRALVVEGTYVLQLADLDVRIFLDATHDDTRERRRIRNRDLDEPIIDQILAIEHAIIARQAARADILIDKDFTVRSRR